MKRQTKTGEARKYPGPVSFFPGAEDKLPFPPLPSASCPRADFSFSSQASGPWNSNPAAALEPAEGPLFSQPLLARALGLSPETPALAASRKSKGGKGQILSFVGGGGKTSAMYRLAGELAQAGARVLVTTTTRILPPAPPLVAEALTHAQGADCRQTLSALDLALSRHSPVALTAPGKDGKAAPLPPHLFAALPESADYVLVEADGSRGLPLKAPASHEPVIPPESDLVIAVAGLSALGRPWASVCHRWERACALLALSPEQPVDLPRLCRLLLHPQGLAKGRPSAASFAILLNQADTLPGTAPGFAEILEELRKTAALPSMASPNCLLLCALQTARPLRQAAFL